MKTTKNCICRLTAPTNRPSAVVFECEPEVRNRLKRVSELTGISQKRILVAGACRQLHRLEKQLEKGIVGLSDALN